jgi:pyruvate-formate lyase-activating enzyme
LNIKYKLIKHERVEDSPFVGCLISAIDCKFNCKNCFNQPLKDLPTKEKDSVEIINEVKSNPFNKGIILGGLEWSNQPSEAINIAETAKNNGLITMLYTGREFNDVKIQLLLKTGVFDYVKCGNYQEDLTTINHIECGVVLASSNQHIYKMGIDY